MIGLWKMASEFGFDFRIKSEILFLGDGSYEQRTWVREGGEESRHHGYGTWSLRKDRLVTKGILFRCRADGEDRDETCSDGSGDSLTLAMRDGVRTLVSIEEGMEIEAWQFAGPQKAFALPDLFHPGAMPAEGRGPQPLTNSTALRNMRMPSPSPFSPSFCHWG